jgi:hypothetical protein
MVEAVEICEKHELPLDRDGECELCRLSEIRSNSPPARSAWWVVIIPLALLLAGIAWAFSSFEARPEVVPQRGVRTTAPRLASPVPASADAPTSEPVSLPARD